MIPKAKHQPCAGGCGELADECMTPGCGSLLAAFDIHAAIGSTIAKFAATRRPAGQPGKVYLGRKRRKAADGEEFTSGLAYPAVDTRTDGVWFWREKDPQCWVRASYSLAATFEPDEEWKASCDHVHHLPWMTCAFESDCLSLRREEARAAGGDWS